MLQTVTNDNIDAREDNIEAENKEDSMGKEEQKVKFIHLRAKGYSFAKIAKELGVSKSTLSNWSQELEEQIARAKAMELEALQEEYYILKEGRIKLLGEQLRAIQQELNGRDLSKVNTDRLMELQLKYFGELKEEYVEPRLVDKTGIKLNSKDIAEQLQSILTRYRAGEINESQAKQQQAILQAMLKAIEQTELEARLEKIEAILESRR
jgi:transposase